MGICMKMDDVIVVACHESPFLWHTITVGL